MVRLSWLLHSVPSTTTFPYPCQPARGLAPIHHKDKISSSPDGMWMKRKVRWARTTGLSVDEFAVFCWPLTEMRTAFTRQLTRSRISSYGSLCALCKPWLFIPWSWTLVLTGLWLVLLISGASKPCPVPPFNSDLLRARSVDLWVTETLWTPQSTQEQIDFCQGHTRAAQEERTLYKAISQPKPMMPHFSSAAVTS